MLDIDATIFCEKETHKRIIIGKNGSMLKKISTFARQDIERFFDCRVFLQTWVKVKEDWRNRAQILQNFGYDEKNLTDNPIKSDSGTRFDTMSDFHNIINGIRETLTAEVFYG